MNITENQEQVTVFRNSNGIPVGLIIAEDQSPAPVFGAFVHNMATGWRWLSESTNKEQVYEEARVHFYAHTHFCPDCECDFECEDSHKCSDPDKESTCGGCKINQLKEV